MDQGLIHSLKARYRKNVVRKIIQKVEKKITLPKISLLGMQILITDWDALTMKTVKTVITSNDNDDAIETEDEPVYCTDRNEFLQMIDSMQNLSLFNLM